MFSDDPEIMALIERRQTQGATGAPGKTPQKGQDYFTPAEVQALLTYLYNALRGSLTPQKGRDYFTLAEIADFLQVVTPKKGIHYEDGKTPVPGKDYPTKRELADYVEALVARIPKAKDGEDGTNGKDAPEVDINEVVKQTIDLIKKKKLIEMRDVRNMPLNMNDMRWHGGAPTFLAGPNITLTTNPTTGAVTIAASSIGGTAVTETPGGTINGVNKVFTITHTPTSGTFILFLNGQYQAGGGNDYNLVGTTITFTTAPAIEYAGLPFFCQYDY